MSNCFFIIELGCIKVNEGCIHHNPCLGMNEHGQTIFGKHVILARIMGAGPFVAHLGLSQWWVPTSILIFAICKSKAILFSLLNDAVCFLFLLYELGKTYMNAVSPHIG